MKATYMITIKSKFIRAIPKLVVTTALCLGSANVLSAEPLVDLDWVKENIGKEGFERWLAC